MGINCEDFEERLAKALDTRKSQGLYRQCESLLTAQKSEVNVLADTPHGQQRVNFSSNDYLGLANSQAATEALVAGAEQWGWGSGGSHLISGHSQPHEQLARASAELVGRDAALIFSSGYMANMGLFQALAQKGDLILADKLNHASLIDGGRLSEAEMKRYPHCDLTALENRLKKSTQNTFVVTDGVFSMDGDIAPLDSISELCLKYQATLVVDDAHGVGVVGENGGGCAELFNLNQKKLPVLMATFGKALGGSGAFVAGSQNVVDYLTQFARSFVYTTAMPPVMALANLANLQLQRECPQIRRQLMANIRLFKGKAKQHQIPLMDSDTAIQPLLVGDSETTISIGNQLKAAGFWVGAVRPPTVPLNTARLRITLSAAHTEQQIAGLVDCLGRLLPNQLRETKKQ